MIRYLFGFMCVCALGLISVGGCTDLATEPDLCEGIECDDGSECTEDACDPETGTCDYVALTRFCTFDCSPSADAYCGRHQQVLSERSKIKKLTMEKRKKAYRDQCAA